MAEQAEAKRERRARIVNAEGEYQAAEKMAQAAQNVRARVDRSFCAIYEEILQFQRVENRRQRKKAPLPKPSARGAFGPASRAGPLLNGLGRRRWWQRWSRAV